MKSKSRKAKRPLGDKTPTRLNELKELNERFFGVLPNFMPQKKLRAMREEWDAHGKENKAPLGAKSL